MLKMHGTTARQKYNLISKSDDKLLQYVTKREWGGDINITTAHKGQHSN